ncbi:armadillo-type protein [Dipodascopsis uninucleata]
MAHLAGNSGNFVPALPEELNINKLASLSTEKQSAYLFAWLSELHKFLNYLDGDGVTAHQIFVYNQLKKLCNVNAVHLTRTIRILAGRCYYEVFSKGDRKVLYDTLNELINLMNTGKSDKNIGLKFYLVHVIGDIYASGGDSILSMAAHGILSSMRLIKGSSGNSGYRAAIYKTLSQIAGIAGGFIDESLCRDIWKQAKTGTTDKSAFVRAAALDSVREIFRRAPSLMNTSDLDSLRSLIIKVSDTSFACIRESAAKCWAVALSVACIVQTAVVEVPAKKMKRPPSSSQASANIEESEAATSTASPHTTKKIIHHSTLSYSEALTQLSSAYTKSSVTVRTRTCIIGAYTEFFLLSGPILIEENYRAITKNLFDEILSANNIINQRSRKLSARRHVVFLMNDIIGQQILGEHGRTTGALVLVNDFLKNFPAVMKDQYEPSKHALTASLASLAFLIENLGSAIIPNQKVISDALIQVLQHPNYTVQTYSAYCLRAFVLQVPAQLNQILTIIMGILNRDISVLKSRRSSNDVASRCVGYSTSLAAVVGVASLRPQYASMDLTSRMFSMATSLLKSSGDVELQVSTAQIQVAWRLIAGLMSLGPDFVKLHLSQLLLLWRSALPKPLAKDTVLEKNSLEYSFLLHVRECALSAILAFLQYNFKLVTGDVAKRIVVMLQNTTGFLNLIISKRIVEDPMMRLLPTLQITDFQLLVRRRIFQCYIQLIDAQHGDGLQADILMTALSIFGDPDIDSPNTNSSSLSSAIAVYTSSSDSIWDVSDNYNYGVSSRLRGFNIEKFSFEKNSLAYEEEQYWLMKDSYNSRLDQSLSEPTISSLEHDYLYLLQPKDSISGIELWQSYPKPLNTSVVDYALELFVLLLPVQTEKVQESILEQTASFLDTTSSQKGNSRKTAVFVNITIAIYGALKLVNLGKVKGKGSFQNESCLKSLLEMLRSIVITDEPYVRLLAADAIGRICIIGGSNFTGAQVKYTLDEIVKNRDPKSRAGLALTLGYVHHHVGGLAAGFHLKTIISILMSLSNDPHPVVHFWALNALSTTAESAGLTLSSHIASALGMVCSLYLSDTHNEECSSPLSADLEVQFSTVGAIGHCLDALINALGPDLQENAKNRELIGLLIQDLSLDDNPQVVTEAIRCYQHALLFAPQFFDLRTFIFKLAKCLRSSNADLRNAAIDCYYQLARNDVRLILSYAGKGLESLFWLSFDMTPNHEGLKSIMYTWISQTGISEARKWVARCQAILVRSIPRAHKVGTNDPMDISVEGSDLGDEEVESFAAAIDGSSDNDDGSKKDGELLKWQTRQFSLKCLEEVIRMNKDSLQNLVPVMGDMIRIAFSASTSPILDMRLIGVKILDDILQNFGEVPDPDFDDSALLEQYQAQIGSALTPAFAADSSPELAAEAINVCADFIASGIVKDVDRMGRILKLLSSALESCVAEGSEIVLGDLKNMSANANVMLKLAILTAWAEIGIASVEKPFLLDVINPFVQKLAPIWLSSLREFAQLRFEPDADNGNRNELDGGAKDIIMPYYEQAWLKIFCATATMIDQNPELVITTIESKYGGHSKKSEGRKTELNDEPAAFFFVMFGICFEALIKAPNGDQLAVRSDIPMILTGMKKILRPEICGVSIYEDGIFSEIVDLLDRITLTEDHECQEIVVGILRNLCCNHPSANKSVIEELARGNGSKNAMDQMLELMRAVMMTISQIYPSFTEGQALAVNGKIVDEGAVRATRAAMDALKDMIECFPMITKPDLYAVYLHLVCNFIETRSCQEKVVPAILPSIRALFKNSVAFCRNADGELYGQVLQQIRSFLAMLFSTLDQLSQDYSQDGMNMRRNCLLCVTVVLTSCEQILSPNDFLIDNCCAAMLEAFSNSELIPIASQCAKSFLITSSHSSFTQMLGRQLLPQLVAMVTRTELTSASGDEISAAICDVLVAFIKSLEGERIAPAMSICIPAILYRLKDDMESSQPSDLRRQLVELANIDAISFKSVVSSLSVGQRSQLERLLRTPSSSSGYGYNNTQSPSIQLKTDFGF